MKQENINQSKMSQDLCQVRGTNVVVLLLVMMFAISSWVDINGLWVELPILTQRLPEGWNLPSYMAVIIQVANIAPLTYVIVHSVFPKRNIEVPVIYTIITVGAVSCLLLSFFWDATAVIAGELHSVGLLALQFFLALVDCTSSVVYLPFMGSFKQEYMTAFYIGEGFSGLLPSLVSLAQGAGEMRCVNQSIMQNVTVDGASTMEPSFVVYPQYETPKFSIEVFFFFLCGMLVVSFVSFTLLNFWPYAKKEKVDGSVESEQEDQIRSQLSFQSSASTASYELNSRRNQPRFLDPATVREAQSRLSEVNSRSHLLMNSPTDSTSSGPEVSEYAVDEVVTITAERKQLRKCEYLTLLLLTAWVNGLGNGVLPSIQSYSCLPYSIDAYHLAVTLSSIANPVACFVTFFLRAKSLRSVSVLSVVGSILATYVMYTAASSPSPPLSHHSLGSFTVVTAWVLVVFFLTYTKVSIASMLREEGKKALLWCGAFTQVGSLVGALIMFFILNFYKLFKQANLCA